MATNFWQRAKQRFPHIPTPLLKTFTKAWRETGDIEQAKIAMREDPRYDNYYKGNRRDDGTLILDERQYYARKLKYKQILQSFGLPVNSPFFEGKFADLVQGEKSMTRFEEDMSRLYVGIATQSEYVKAYYAQKFGEGNGNVSVGALFASALDTSKSPLVYEQEIRSAQLGGSAATYGFDIDLQQVQKLSQFGLEGTAANELFSLASRSISNLQQMVERHNDPDDEFDINDYTNALVVKDADDLRRLTRVVGAEKSLFNTGSAIAQDQSGRMSGLF